MSYIEEYPGEYLPEPISEEGGIPTWLIILCVVMILACVCSSSIGGSLLYAYDPFGWKEIDDGVPKASGTSGTNQNTESNATNTTTKKSNNTGIISTLPIDPLPQMVNDDMY